MDNIVKLLHDKSNGEYKVERFTVTPYDFDYVYNENMTPNETYVRLMCGDEVLMSNTPYEWDSNMEFIENAKGNVFIGGLGLGMIVMEIQDKEKVKSITIVEKSKEVIDIISSQLPFNKKVNIICDDVFHYHTDKMFDTIYFDIWNSCEEEVFTSEMPYLMKHYDRNLVNDGYMNCWQRNEYLELIA